MTLDQFPFRELTTAAGIAAAAVLIRQVLEAAKESFLPWLDANNERKGAFILSALLYLAWLAVYGTDLGTDGPVALASFWACAIAAMGTNEAVDAAKGVVAKSVVQTVRTDPVVATEATASGVTTGPAVANGTAATGTVAADADASSADAPAGSSAPTTDSGAALEPGPDVELNVNDGEPVDDDDEDGDVVDPARAGSG